MLQLLKAHSTPRRTSAAVLLLKEAMGNDWVGPASALSHAVFLSKIHFQSDMGGWLVEAVASKPHRSMAGNLERGVQRFYQVFQAACYGHNDGPLAYWLAVASHR